METTVVFLDSRGARVGVNLLTGIAMFVYWIVVRPTAQASATQSQWPYVLWFSGTILTVAFAVPAFGRMIGGKWVVRLALVAGATAAWNSAANIVEDGFGQDWAFVLFAIGTAGMLLSNMALAVVLAVRGRAQMRALSLIPLGTAAGILAFVSVGGPIMLVIWLAAALIAARWKPEWTEQPTGTATGAEIRLQSGVAVSEGACTPSSPNRSGQTIVSRLSSSRRRACRPRARVRLIPVVLMAIVAAACAPVNDTTTIDDARAELLGLIWDVTAADGYRYQLTDDRGEPMGPMEVIQVGESEYAAVYFWTPQTGPSFKVALATSTNLLDWTWRADLADSASQPTIKETEDGGFVVAWEQESPAEDEAWIRLAYYPSWDALLGAEPSKVFDAPRQLSECGEGTPNIDTASSTHVEFGLHYYAGCEVDRQARGTTDWVTWEAEPAALLDRAVLFQGYSGSIGDRATLDFRGHRFTFLEASFILDDWSSFRVLIYDEVTGAADRAQFGVDADTVSIPGSWSKSIPGPPAEPPSEHVFILTHRASASVSNPSLALVDLDGRQALVVTLYIQQPGLGGDETGELIYYRFVDEPAQNEE